MHFCDASAPVVFSDFCCDAFTELWLVSLKILVAKRTLIGATGNLVKSVTIELPGKRAVVLLTEITRGDVCHKLERLENLKGLTRCSEGSNVLAFPAGFQVRQEAKESHWERVGCAS